MISGEKTRPRYLLNSVKYGNSLSLTRSEDRPLFCKLFSEMVASTAYWVDVSLPPDISNAL